MVQWEPLADKLPVDTRRLATQLRRMKDRSALTVPALAARTAQPAETWERALAGQAIPPLHAVEVLAQASGADYDRIRALWQLAEKAERSAARGVNRTPGHPIPYPDPLDPLSADEGLPRPRRRALLLTTAGLLAVAALLTVALTAGTSTGDGPTGNADPTGPRQLTSAGPSGDSRAGAPGSGGSRQSATTPSHNPRTGTAPGAAADADLPSAMGSASPSPLDPPSADPKPPSPSHAPTTAPPPEATSAPATGVPTPSPTPTPATPTSTTSGLCLKVIVVGICLG
ncbi:helix-turn-helix domain-containing protein [Streptomyces sp. NBC_01190]|uniref:transcriptional regulator n=1 Tax=Streptomyces sp. NBC_01190 TaxID=2903767 RepID=UPI00386BDF89|nr:hypothetical protein OG519_21745 [Streptomyces sp. NBC_01190]